MTVRPWRRISIGSVVATPRLPAGRGFSAAAAAIFTSAAGLVQPSSRTGRGERASGAPNTQEQCDCKAPGGSGA